MVGDSSNTNGNGADVLLDVVDLHKSFGSVLALRGVSISARRREITALVGDNGAGKSTLIKCISGVYKPDSGAIAFDGEEVSHESPEEARKRGIETVYQDLALVNQLTVWQNVFLNRELTKSFGPLRLVDRKAMIGESRGMLERLSIRVPSVVSRVHRLSGGQRQGVAIGRAAGWGSKLVIMDEPTAALGVQESARVEELIRSLSQKGLTVLLISHKIDQVMRLSDHVWVLRQGEVVGGRRTGETTGAELVEMITGLHSRARSNGT